MTNARNDRNGYQLLKLLIFLCPEPPLESLLTPHFDVTLRTPGFTKDRPSEPAALTALNRFDKVAEHFATSRGAPESQRLTKISDSFTTCARSNEIAPPIASSTRRKPTLPIPQLVPRCVEPTPPPP